MTTALINRSILSWARERAGLGLEELAEKLGNKVEKLILWESGEAKPTFKQAQELANTLHIPFGFLFLAHPPAEALPIPDLRTIGSQATDSISLDLRDLVNDVLRKQDWYRDHLIEEGSEPLPFVGRFRLEDSIEAVAADVTATLALSIADRVTARDSEAFLGLLMEKAEAVGIWVMRSGIVGNNTHRGLVVEEFRGFAICDDIAPVVFINGKDAKAAQVFTLAHELVHIWVGESGISDLSLVQPARTNHRRAELFCNAVAAEVLVPQRDLISCWDSQQSLDQTASDLAGFFRVSTVVVARRALDIGLIEWPAYFAYFQRQAEIWRQVKKGSGGDAYRTIPIRNGRRFTEAVIQSAFQRTTLLRDAGSLLGISPSKIGRLAQEIGVG
jgi:Zn-dependent peptidase ImmA (M78 family)/DNA-binding XRE family transcriptional regulator